MREPVIKDICNNQNLDSDWNNSAALHFSSLIIFCILYLWEERNDPIPSSKLKNVDGELSLPAVLFTSNTCGCLNTPTLTASDWIQSLYGGQFSTQLLRWWCQQGHRHLEFWQIQQKSADIWVEYGQVECQPSRRLFYPLIELNAENTNSYNCHINKGTVRIT